MADAKFGRDFYADRRNRSAALAEVIRRGEANGGEPRKYPELTDRAAAIQLLEMFEKAASQAGLERQRQRQRRQECRGDLDVLQVGYVTTDACEVRPSGDPNAQNTCSEFLEAARDHEWEHQDICVIFRDMPQAMKDEMERQLGGPRKSLAGSAEGERRGYATELWHLKNMHETAHARCSAMKHFDDKHFKDEEARQKAINDWVNKAVAKRGGR